METHLFRPSKYLLVILSLTMIMAVSCDEAQFEQEDLRISIQSGDGQDERTGATLPEQLVVKVTNILDQPIANVTVDFSTTAAGASLEPSGPTDADGLASCTFILGTEEGTQSVTAAITGDSEVFTATATTPECPEEDLSPACLWPRGRIYIVTTSSAILGTAGGSVILEFDTVTGAHSLVYQSDAELQDIAFSPRGEMFVADEYGIYKVARDPAGLTAWVSFSGTKDVEIEPNFGSVLTMIDEGTETLSGVFCPTSSLSAEVMVDAIRRDCLAVDPLSRDTWYVTGNYYPFTLVRRAWDGRSAFGPVTDSRLIMLESAVPNGMCADSSGTLYVLLDGTAVNRRIGRMSPDGTWTNNFYNLYALSATGRYGDMAWSGGNLYMVDTRNNRIVVISDDGTFVAQYTDEDFSAQLHQSEKYGIAASPGFNCR